MGEPYSEWCAEFITWCVNQVDERYGTSLLRNEYPYYDSPKDGAPFFIQRHRFVSGTGKLNQTGSKQWWPDTGEYLTDNGYIPNAGDYMWLYNPSVNKTRTVHVALVEGVSRATDGKVTVHVIEGNMPDRVQRATYSLDDYRIYGFGTPNKIIMTEMRLHSTYEDIVEVKAMLKQLGYYTTAETSMTYTDKLKTAVVKFQKANSLKKSGIIDRDTWLLMKKLTSGDDT